MTVPACRFCQAHASRQTIKGEFVYGGTADQHFWECDVCRMIYLFPPMSAEDEKKFYRQEFEKFMDTRSGGDKDWNTPEGHFRSSQAEADRRMGFLEAHLKPGMNVLEIGCSSGFMLDRFRKAGCQAYGVEPSEIFIDFARSIGLSVFKNIDDLNAVHNIQFDLIIHFYVLEHISRPVDFLNYYMGMLLSGGKMVFEVPCASDPLITLYEVPAFHKFYWSCAHHWYFNKASLSAVIERTGYDFQLLPEQRYDLSNHITWMRHGKPGGMGRYHAIWGAELEDMYRQRLKEKWICDTIVSIIAKLNRKEK